MIQIYPEQLTAHLREGLHSYYLLSGNEPLILQESQDLIRQAAKKLEFNEFNRIDINTHTDWDAIFSICQTMSLFANRKILLLILPENGQIGSIKDNLIKLFSLLHQDILLILRGVRLTKAYEHSTWFTALHHSAVCIICQSLQQRKLPRWVANRAKIMNLTLDHAANYFLCDCYEGNLTELSQALERLSLLHPDGKLTLSRVKQAVHDATHFTIFHWIDTLLEGNSERACYILQQLKKEGIELTFLLRTLQRELLLVITVQRQMNCIPLHTLLDQNNVWKDRRHLMTRAVHRLSMSHLQQAIKKLVHIELGIKKNHHQSFWLSLETLSILLCSKTLMHELFLYDE